MGVDLVAYILRRRAISLAKTYAETIQDDSPVGFWLLDEASGNAIDSSVNSTSLTYNNSPTRRVAGPSSQIPFAVGLNGTNQNVRSAQTSVLPTNSAQAWSAEAWFRHTLATVGVRQILCLRNLVNTTNPNSTFFLEINRSSAGDVSVLFPQAGSSNNITIIQAGSYNDGNWHHVMATAASGSGVSLYIDGTLIGTNSTSRNTANNARTLTVGSNSTIQFFPGDIAACSVYNYQLNPAQVAAHYAAGI